MFGHDSSQDKPADKDTNDTSAIWQPSVKSDDSTTLPTDLPANTSPVLTKPDDSSVPTPPSDSSENVEDLASIKQQALKQLGPLVGNLDQPPEEKFRTTMMMIQASDDKGLIKVAYEAAQTIPDEKARAQALLDIINEINYFSQQSKS